MDRREWVRLREQLHVSQAELAQELGCHPKTVAAVEAHRRGYRWDERRAQRWMEALRRIHERRGEALQ